MDDNIFHKTDDSMIGRRGFGVPCIRLLSTIHKNANNSMENSIQVTAPLLQLSKMPLKDRTNLQTISNHDAAFQTPTKPIKLSKEPLTPTANLKLLTDLASREILFEDKVQGQKENHSNDGVLGDNLKLPSRKEKSLGLLCIKFLERYPEYPPANVRLDISLDEASKDLNVERRRIYDIVNVLESVQIIKRCATNLYTWLGKTHLKDTLALLKAAAQCEKMDEQIKKCSASHSSVDTPGDSEFEKTAMDEDGGQARKEKSLGLMSQKFIMLFLVSKPPIVNLNLAARILIGNSTIDYKKSTAYKTKIRRLYDIANILTSIRLIQKVHVNELCGRKPAFQYIGPEIDDDSVKTVLRDLPTSANISSASLIGTKRPFSQLAANSGSVRVKLPRTKSENLESCKNSMCNRLGAKTLIRHPSLQDVCTVAEKEWRKLSYPLASKEVHNGDAQNTVNSKSQEGGSSMAVGSLLGQMLKSTSSTAVLLSSDGKPFKVIAVSSPITIASSSIPQTKTTVPTDVTSGIEVPGIQVPLVLKLSSLASSNISKDFNDGHMSGKKGVSTQTCDENGEMHCCESTYGFREGTANDVPKKSNAEMVTTESVSSNKCPSHIILRKEGESVQAVVNPNYHSRMFLLNDLDMKGINQQQLAASAATNRLIQGTELSTSIASKSSTDLQEHSKVSPANDVTVVSTNAPVSNVVILPLDVPRQSISSSLRAVPLKAPLQLLQKLQHKSTGTSQDLILQLPSLLPPFTSTHENSFLLNVPLKSTPSSCLADNATPAGSKQSTFNSSWSFSPNVVSVSTLDRKQAAQSTECVEIPLVNSETDSKTHPVVSRKLHMTS